MLNMLTVRTANVRFGHVTPNDINGSVERVVLKFPHISPVLPTYYQMKTHLALSGADEQDEPWENLAACRHNLKEAEKALAESKNVYRDAEDVQLLKRQ